MHFPTQTTINSDSHPQTIVTSHLCINSETESDIAEERYGEAEKKKNADRVTGSASHGHSILINFAHQLSEGADGGWTVR